MIPITINGANSHELKQKRMSRGYPAAKPMCTTSIQICTGIITTTDIPLFSHFSVTLSNVKWY